MSMFVREHNTFKLYRDLPFELRAEINDAMDPADRCRFTRCSKMTGREVKNSKNFICRLRFEASENYICIEVSFDEKESEGYALKFERKYGRNVLTCFDLKSNELWEERFARSSDLLGIAVRRFEHLLRLYQNKIKYLCLSGKLFENELKDYDFGIRSLDNLKGLLISNNTDLRFFFSKIRNPLKDLSVINCEALQRFQEIYEVQRCLNLPELQLTNEQFKQLSASSVIIHIGRLNEVDIQNFVLSWQNGTIGRVVKKYIWRIPSDSSFDKERLFRLLGVGMEQHGVDIEEIDVHINHHVKLGTSANLKFVVENVNDTERGMGLDEEVYFDEYFNEIVPNMLDQDYRIYNDIMDEDEENFYDDFENIRDYNYQLVFDVTE